jgi:hypothetical protein
LQLIESPVLDPTFGYLICIGIALLFATAGWHKLRSLEAFIEVFVAYRVLPEGWGRRVAWLIPGLELAIAAALPWEITRRSALTAAMGLLIAYAAGVGLNLARGRRELDCGCGTIGSRRSIAGWMVWRNLALALLAAMAALPWASRPLNGSDTLTIVGGLAAIAALYVAIDQLLGEISPKSLRMSGRAL